VGQFGDTAMPFWPWQATQVEAASIPAVSEPPAATVSLPMLEKYAARSCMSSSDMLDACACMVGCWRVPSLYPCNAATR
jgi:hypothetical protein